MPLALVLHDTFGTWQRDVRKLAEWNQLVQLEQTLLDRARGAFMARWFGTGLPIMVGNLRVAIANIDALAARYRELRRQARRETSDPNLTEPLAGISGSMIGALLAPTSSIVLLAVISEQMPGWITTLAAALNTVTYGGLGLLLFTIGVPVAALGLPLAAIAYRDELGVIHRFLGTLARLFSAVRRFLEQLIGPREGVRNPLLAQLLGVLDHLAALVPFLFAFVWFTITWIGPKLEDMAKQLDIFITFTQDVYFIIRDIVDNLFEGLQSLYVGKGSPWAIAQGILWTFRQWIKTLKEQFGALFKTAAPAFEKVSVLEKGTPVPGKTEMRALSAIKRALQEAFDKVLPFIKQMTTENWLLKRLAEMGKRFEHIKNVFTGLKEVKKKPPGTWQRIKGRVKEYFINKLKEEAAWPTNLELPKGPTVPFFPIASETFLREQWAARMRWKQPDVLSYFLKPGGGYVFTLSPEAEEAAKQLRRPPVDVFTAERRALLKGKRREDLLSEAQATETSLRTMLFAVIDNLLPPAVTNEMPKLQGLLWELDEFLYGKKTEFPVRDLPGGDRLSVKVVRVRVHAPGMRDRVVRVWGKDLKTALEKQVYRTQREVPA